MEPKDKQAEMLKAVSVPELFLFILNRDLRTNSNPALNIKSRTGKLLFAGGLEGELNARCGKEWTVSDPVIETPDSEYTALVYKVLFKGEEIGTYKVTSYKPEGSDGKYTLEYLGRIPGYKYPPGTNQEGAIRLLASSHNPDACPPTQYHGNFGVDTSYISLAHDLFRQDYHQLQLADDEVRPRNRMDDPNQYHHCIISNLGTVKEMLAELYTAPNLAIGKSILPISLDLVRKGLAKLYSLPTESNK